MADEEGEMEGLADILSVLIGLVFVYLVLSMIVSYLVEMYATLFEKRQAILANSIQLLMNPRTQNLASFEQVKAQIYPELAVKVQTRSASAGWLKRFIARVTSPLRRSSPEAEKINLMCEFYKHPLIMSLSKPQRLPSYIEPELFSRVIVDLLQTRGEEAFKEKIFKNSQNLAECLQGYSLHQLAQFLQTILKQACVVYINKCSENELQSLLSPELSALASQKTTLIAIFSANDSKGLPNPIPAELNNALKQYSIERLQQLVLEKLKKNCLVCLKKLDEPELQQVLQQVLPQELQAHPDPRRVISQILALDDNALMNYSLDHIRQLLPEKIKKASVEEINHYSKQDLGALLPPELKMLAGSNGAMICQVLSTESLDLVEMGLNQVANNQCLREALKPYFMDARRVNDSAEKRFTTFNDHLSAWYKSAMDRANGWYTRDARVIAFLFSLVVAFMLNADTIEIVHNLYGNANLRALVNNAATQYIQSHLQGPETASQVAGVSIKATQSQFTGTPAAQATGMPEPQATPTSDFDGVIAQVNNYENLLPMPLGWDGFKNSIANRTIKLIELPFVLLIKLCGLLATTLAISQGSSIWFQMLSKLINLRSSGAKPGEAGSDGGK
jgi:hypothetical protein